MKAITLGYHDVGDESDAVAPSVRLYRLTPATFGAHLSAIERAMRIRTAGTIMGASRRGWEKRLFLTFDDGALGSYTWIAPQLELHGWRGHFFIITNRIGTPGYLDRWQIRELHERGHVIGTHTHTHPERMSSLPRKELADEWKRSCDILSELVGRAVRVGSVANGYYSRAVARSAAASGIEVLFTSEPVTHVAEVDGCLVLGRYSIQRGTIPCVSGAIASGRIGPRWRQYLIWNLKKPAKAIGGDGYIFMRRLLVAQRFGR